MSVLFVCAWSVFLPALNIRSSYEPKFQDPEEKELRVLPEPLLKSRSVLLFETSTGTILLQNNVDVPIPPASLTKLVVMALALDFIQKSNIHLDTLVSFSPRAWAEHAPSRSSLMFLGPGQKCTWHDLLLGLAVDSGNDAAVAIAEQVDGTVESFVAHMNSWCSALGLKATHFVEPSGYDAANSTTARDYAYLVWNYIKMFPQAIELYHSVHEFTYPHEMDGKPIRQFNRNKLLFAYPGADGLKTGYIDESGYNLAFTAERNSMRVAGIVLGAKSELERFDDARRLLDYGFNEYKIVELNHPAPKPIRVWNGSQALIQLSKGVVTAVVPRSVHKAVLKAGIDQKRELSGPLTAATTIAWATFSTTDGQTIFRYPLVAGIEIHEANPIIQGAEALYLEFRSLWGIQRPQSFSSKN